MYKLLILTLLLFSLLPAFAQKEAIDNKTVIEMSKAGLSTEIILKKMTTSRTTFDVSAPALIELKTSGVHDLVITAMMERSESSPQAEARRYVSAEIPGVNPPTVAEKSTLFPVATSREALVGARTIAFSKSSVQPSRQALEKELMKRKDFQQLNLTILRYKETADLFVDIGFVSGSWITHRYVYRIYDRRSGAVITAGETTSWGSLAENLARHIAKGLLAVRAGKMG